MRRGTVGPVVLLAACAAASASCTLFFGDFEIGATSGTGGGGTGGTGGSPTTTRTGTGMATSTSTSAATGMGAGTGTSTSSTGGGDPCADLFDCSQCPDSSSCSTCCADPSNSTSGAAYAEIINDIVFECACVDANAACNSICTTAGMDFCNGENPDQACIDCIQGEIDNSGQCLSDGIDDCANSATCVPIIQCYQACP